jgi:1,2-phenylacetyl-CoA epoxidase PaaB subunit
VAQGKENVMRGYRVYLHSQAGWEHYAGYVDVVAADDQEAAERARDRLARGAFRERPRSSWIVERVERLA